MEIQEEAKLDEGVARIFGITPDQGGLQLDDMRQKAAVSLADYGRMLGDLLEKSTISIPPPVQLQWWHEGSRIKVVADHPEAERIEAVLNGNGDVVGKFKELEVLHEILRNTELAGVGTTENTHFNVGLTSTGPIAFFSE